MCCLSAVVVALRLVGASWEHLPSGWVLPLRRLGHLAWGRLLVPGLVPGALAVPEALVVLRQT